MAILKIRDDKGVITNIAAIRGENGKSPIIKNGTWWTYDDELEDYIDTGLGAEKESNVTKENVEKVLTGTIDSHNHDNVYVKEAPSDSKQYVRYNGEWSAIDLSSVNPYDASWVLNDTATEGQINELLDAIANKRRITVEFTDPDIVADETNNIFIGITSHDNTSTTYIKILIDKTTKLISRSRFINSTTITDNGILLSYSNNGTDTTNIELNVKGNGTKYLADNGEYQTVIVPTKVSELTNDSGYLVSNDISNLATKDEVATKVDKVSGKGLSTNDYTTDEKNKLAGIAAGAEVNVNADWNATSGDAMIINKPSIPSKTSELTNDSDYITSSAVDTKINSAVASVYRVRGSVDNYESLPSTNVIVGDVYNLLDTGANYACISIDPIIWDKLSETIDLSAYSTTEENDSKYQVKGNYITNTELEDKGYATIESVNSSLSTKLDSSAYVPVSSTTSGYMSSEDYNKLASIEENADVNIIESITVNGDAVSVTDKTAVIEVNETHGVLLNEVPTDTTLTYQEDNKTKSFTIGMSVIYPDNSSGDGYGMSFFKGTTSEDKAIWGKAVSDEKYALKSDTYTKEESDEFFAKKSDTVRLLPSSVFELMEKYSENGTMAEEDYNTLMSYAPNETNDYMIDYPGVGIYGFNIEHDSSSVYVTIRFSLAEADYLYHWTINKDTKFLTISYSGRYVVSQTEGEFSISAESMENDGTASGGSITLKRNGSGDKFLSDNGEYKEINTQTGIKLDQKPTEDTLTYIGANGETLNFTVGMSAICPDTSSEDGYSIYFFKGITSEGKAIWGNNGSIYEHPKFTAHDKGLYKISVTEEGHIDSAEPVVKEDITALGIPAQDTVYTHPAYTERPEGLYKVTVDAQGHVSDATEVTKEDITALGIPSSDTTYTAGSGLTLSGTQFEHASSLTAGTAGTSSATNGTNTIAIPYFAYNATGHVIAAGTHTHTIKEATTSAVGLMSSADKTKMNRLESYTTATTVASLNVNYQTIYVTLSANASLSASGTGTTYNGRTITAYVYTSSAYTITIPTSGSYVSMCGSSYTTKAGGWVEFSLVCIAGIWHIAKLEQE